MQRAVVATLAVLSLSACQHRHPLSNEALQRFDQGSGAILTLDGDMNAFGCGAARYNFRNTVSSAEVSIKSEAGPGIGIAPAGSYRLVEVFCQVWGTGSWAIPVAGWFSPLDVKDGEVVHAGTLVVTPFGTTESGANLLKTPEMKADWAQVPTYKVREDLETAKRVLRPEIGDKVDRMVSRPPTLLITEQQFADMIKRGYQPDSNGVMPTRAQAKARVTDELAKTRLAAIAD